MHVTVLDFNSHGLLSMVEADTLDSSSAEAKGVLQMTDGSGNVDAVRSSRQVQCHQHCLGLVVNSNVYIINKSQ